MGFKIRVLLSFACMILLFTYSYGQSSGELNSQAVKFIKSNPDTAIYIAQLSFETARELDDLHGMAIAKRIASKANMRLRNNVTAYAHNTEAFDLLQRADTADYYNIYSLHRDQAVIMDRIERYQDAAQYAKESIDYLHRHIASHPKIAQEKKHHLLIDKMSYYHGRYLRKAGDIKASDAIFYQLLDESLKHQNYTVYADVSNQLGLTALEVELYDVAIDFFDKALRIDDVPAKQKAHAHHNTAVALMKQADQEQARYHFNHAIKLNQSIKSKKSLFINLLDLGESYYITEDYQKALDKWQTALATYSSIDTNPDLFAIYKWIERANVELGIPTYKEYRVKFDQLDKQYRVQQQQNTTLEKQRNFDRDLMMRDVQRIQEQTRQERNRRMIQIALAIILLACGGGTIYFLIVGRKVLPYDIASKKARALLEKKYEGANGVFAPYVAEFDFPVGKDTLRKAIKETPISPNHTYVQKVLDDLAPEKGYKVLPVKKKGK